MSDTTAVVSPPAGRLTDSERSARRALLILKYGTLAVFALVLIGFFIPLSDSYLTWENIRGVLTLAAPLMIISMALTLPLRVGDFDLSLGYAAQLYSAIAVVLMAKAGMSSGLSIALTILIATLVGTALGLIIAYSRVNAFVITLAAGSIMLGFEITVSGNESVNTGLGDGFLALTRDSIVGIPIAIWITAVVLLLLWILQDRMVLGRKIAAVGASIDAARLSGVRVELVRTVAFSVVGAGTAIAGILIASQASAYYPSSAIGLLLPAYAACFLGSTILRPGSFHVVGTAIGVVFLQFVSNGIVQLNWSSAVSNVVTGGILMAAVLTSTFGRRVTR